MAKVTGVSSEISSEKLNASLKNFLGALQEGFADLPTVLSIFKLTEIELELEVSATGEVSWIIAGAEVEVKAGLKVKLERV